MRIAFPPPIKETELMLRPIDLTDIDAWYSYLSLPRVLEHTSWKLGGVKDLRALIEWYNSADESSAIRFAIIDPKDRTLVGTIGFHTISVTNRTAELAYDIHPSYANRGFATACCRAVTEWGLSERAYVRVQAAALESNAPSIRVLEKSAFVFQGILRSYRMVRNEPRDFRLYAKVKPARCHDQPSSGARRTA